MMDDTLKPGRASGRTGCDAVGERLAKDPPRAGDSGTPEPADLDAQMNGMTVGWQVRQPPIIPAMDL